jgi:uncharacterized membrane protein YgcG
MTPFKQFLAIFLAWCLAMTTVPGGLAFQNPPPPPVPAQGAQPSPEELQRLVAPIALYPDSLVAQILAASTFPEEIVEADRWMQEHRNLQGQALADEVNKQPWDASVKALTAFPSVLSNMDKNLSWTSSLGDAYVNDQDGVMNAIQVMRQRAEASGNLKSTPQQTVTTTAGNIYIQPVNPEVVYVPAYDPWLVYGPPLAPWPGWYWYPGLYVTTPGVLFAAGIGIGFFAGFGWGWHHWGFDWDRRELLHNRAPFVARGNTFVNRNVFANNRALYNNRFQAFQGREGYRPGFQAAPHGQVAPRFGGAAREAAPHAEAAPQARPLPHFQAPPRGAFSGMNRGAMTRGFSERGFSSFGAPRGGAFHGGGFAGGFHGGGFHGGGGRR